MKRNISLTALILMASLLLTGCFKGTGAQVVVETPVGMEAVGAGVQPDAPAENTSSLDQNASKVASSDGAMDETDETVIIQTTEEPAGETGGVVVAPPTKTPVPPTPALAPPAPSGCPAPVVAMSLAPRIPAYDLRVIPQEIDFFLSDGGTLEKLASGLTVWGVLLEGEMILQGNFDDDDAPNAPDIVIPVQMLAPGLDVYNVWVFNCQGEMLYQAFPAAFERPILLNLLELDGDNRSQELFYGLETCNESGCQATWHAIKWIGPYPGQTVDLFVNLPAFHENFSALDFLPVDGMSGLRFIERSIPPAGAAPERDILHTWALQGEVYTEYHKDYTPSVYRHQMLRSGDDAIDIDQDLAIARYREAFSNPNLFLWPDEVTGEARSGVDAFARYRIMQVAMLKGDFSAASAAHDELNRFAAQPGAREIVALGNTFWQLYNGLAGHNLYVACDMLRPSPAYQPALQIAQRYGFIRDAGQLCPF